MSTKTKFKNLYSKLLGLSVGLIFLTACPIAPNSGITGYGDNIGNGSLIQGSGLDSNASPSEDSANPNDTNYESEGVFSLPVTPPKAIDALGISFELENNVSESSFVPVALADDLSGSCKIKGEKGTAPAGSILILSSQDQSVVQNILVGNDGEFLAEVKSGFLNNTSTLTFADATDQDTLITIDLDDTCQNYTIGISTTQTEYAGSMSVFEDYVFYNSMNAEGLVDIKVQSLHGGNALAIFSTDSPLDQMRFFTTDSVNNYNREAMILGVDKNQNLVRVDKSGTAILNDYVNGGLTPDGNHTINLDYSSIAPTANGLYSMFYGINYSDKFQATPLLLIPTESDTADIIFDNVLRSYMMERTLAWVDDTHLLTLNRYDLPAGSADLSGQNNSQQQLNDSQIIQDQQSGIVDQMPDVAQESSPLEQNVVNQSISGAVSQVASPQSLSGPSQQSNLRVSTAEIYDLGEYANLNPDEARNKYGTQAKGRIILNSQLKLMTMRPIRMPVISPSTAKTPAYFIFNTLDLNKKEQLAISDYDKAVILTSSEDHILNTDVSMLGDFVVFENQSVNGSSKIMLVHLPTMTVVPLFTEGAFEDVESMRMPIFSREIPYALSYQVKQKDGSMRIAVVNLESFGTFKNLIEQTAQSDDFNLTGIFDGSLNLTNIPLLDDQEIFNSAGIENPF